MLNAPAYANGSAAVSSSWLQAKIGLPEIVTGNRAIIGRLSEPRVSDAVERITESAATPIVFVMHGCSGIDAEEQNFLYLLTLNGYIVVMPDSFAQPERRSLCNTRSHRAKVDENVYMTRQNELEYALAQIDTLGWLQAERRIYLVGFSEGAAIAALYTQALYTQYVFNGTVIVGWHCQGEGPLYGLNVPPQVPILAMVMRRDPWYPADGGRHCGELFGTRPDSKSITLDGSGHAVFSAANVDVANLAKAELLAFFAQHQAQD